MEYPIDWDKYYVNTTGIPESKRTESFLSHIPNSGRILDFGAGSGRWAIAFSRDRSDLIIDVIDQNIDKAVLLQGDWRGEKIKSSFQDFYPRSSYYDGIWAEASLFFLNNVDLRACFNKLTSALKDNGIIYFSMTDDCPTAHKLGYSGLSESDISSMLRKEGMKTISFFDKQEIYRLEKFEIKTYYVIAQKISL
jgi:hypothetical protein